MIHIAIVEDDADSRDSLLALLLRYDKEGSFRILSFPDGESFLASCHNEQKYDLVFLDIGLPKKDGMQVAKEFRQVDEEAAIIFLTMLSQYAIEGYEVNAYSYMIKPVSNSMLTAKLDRLFAHRGKGPSFLQLSSDSGEHHIVKLSDIVYIETFGHYCLFYTGDGIYRQRISIKKLENDLKDKEFARASGSYLVNFRHLKGWDNDQLLLDNNVKIPLGRRLKDSFFTSLSLYQDK